MKINSTNQKNKIDNSFVDECIKNQAIFASFIDLIPAKIYLNPEDHSNWNKFVTNESAKKKKTLAAVANVETQIKKAKPAENGKHESGDEEDDDDIEHNEDFCHINKFDPRVFKTVSQIFKDFALMEEREQKEAKTKKFTFNKAAVNGNAEKNTSIKLFNKSQHKSLSKQNAEEGKPDESSGRKPAVKRVSKSKELKNVAAKRQRQRYDSHTEPQIVEIDHSEANSMKDRKQILNRNGQVVFSKFDFTADKTLNIKKAKSHEKITTTNANPKDYKKLIKKLQDKRENVEKLKLTEPEKANEIELKDKWKTAIDKASGIKVKDDVGLLKKAVKKFEKKKERSKKNWQERVKETEANKNKAYDKRDKNIAKRKEKVKENKMKKLKKKGRIMPGF